MFWSATADKKGLCDMLDHTDGKEKDNECSIDIHILDDSGLYFNFITGENFGCVSFKPKKDLVV
jgi:hypothetical protein